MPRRKRSRLALIVFVLFAAGALWAWASREDIADDFIAGELEALGVEATYDVSEVSTDRQVLENLVFGDPDQPDLTIERVSAEIEYGFGAPTLGLIEIEGARLFGSYQGGQLSFGSLDPLLFAESDEPAGLPALDIRLRDARALIESDFGRIGVKAEGEGMLDDGFVGKLAATAPNLAINGCRTDAATLFGDLTTEDGSPSFAGPIRLRSLECADAGIDLASADIVAEVVLTPDFAGVSGDLSVSASQFVSPSARVGGLNGDARFDFVDGMLTARHDVTAIRTVTDFGAIDSLNADGTVRVREGFERVEWDTRVEGEGASIGSALAEQLRDARMATAGTLAEPLFARFERGFAGAARDGRLAADVTVRSSPESMSVVIPEARLRSGVGETILGVSRLAWSSSPNAPGRLSANIATGGSDLPRLTGRMERIDGGELALRLQMDEYAASDSRIAVPEMMVRQAANGALRFDGSFLASGALPGGKVQDLVVPMKGAWSPRDGLAIGQECTAIRFASLQLYQLALDRESLRVCPKSGRPILSFDKSLQFAGSLGAVTMKGEIAGSPVSLAASSAEIAYPGNAAFTGLKVALGSEAEPIRLSAESLSANFGETIGGTFDGGQLRFDFAASDPEAIYQIPFELVDLAGDWTYTDALEVSGTSFDLQDRLPEARFNPLAARDATLTLAGSTITAQADLRHPASDRIVTSADITHELGSGVGNAQLRIAGLTFDQSLQPDDLTILTKGFVSLANGVVSGNGRIDWSPDNVTSSGVFSTDSFDFAAAFGPVKDASATVEFTDLLALTTAPAQEIALGSINTGIEVLDGRVRYSLVGGRLVKLEDARWPFMGGELIMRPVDLNFAVPEERRYIFEIIDLDAGTFISEMEFGNLAATGKFNGSIPIVFDAQGNGRIEGGLLISESPGGNLSYVGDLTYEDMGAITNYAFNMLRSLDYRQMAVTMDGSLTGEIITSIRFDGISQGEGATQNFVTRRLAKLPIRFNVNVRSQFWELSRLLRSTYDAEYLRDPCLTSDPLFRATEFYRVVCAGRPDLNPEDEPLDDLLIQGQESENTP